MWKVVFLSIITLSVFQSDSLAQTRARASTNKKIALINFKHYNLAPSKSVQSTSRLCRYLRQRGIRLISESELKHEIKKCGLRYRNLNADSSLSKLAEYAGISNFLTGVISCINNSNTYLISVNIRGSDGSQIKNFVLNYTGKSFDKFLNTTVEEMSRKISSHL